MFDEVLQEILFCLEANEVLVIQRVLKGLEGDFITKVEIDHQFQISFTVHRHFNILVFGLLKLQVIGTTQRSLNEIPNRVALVQRLFLLLFPGIFGTMVKKLNGPVQMSGLGLPWDGGFVSVQLGDELGLEVLT
jgi:hypothetical protein